MCVWHNSTRICSKSIEFRHSAQKVKETSTRTTRRTLGVGGGVGAEGVSRDKCNSAPKQVYPSLCVCVRRLALFASICCSLSFLLALAFVVVNVCVFCFGHTDSHTCKQKHWLSQTDTTTISTTILISKLMKNRGNIQGSVGPDNVILHLVTRFKLVKSSYVSSAICERQTYKFT